ncbi:hypothetical protein LC653_25025 [Nostoc sp. CHAB 5784]|uniref:hypothetical protein n=1 Tax=Nostoc mirabile TaxID=2907820 RepID=UPI001E62E49D|nr:hypothetical protein [Nostoc mirabile]MCC5667061.1 hypothetical protein [Nostoc mirabile CHAB5784]
MYHDAPLQQLELLVPWELPLERELSQSNQIKLTKALTELLTALAESDVEQGIVILENAGAELEIYDTFPAEVTSTNTTLKYWEIEDFDNYFRVRHVQTTEPEICLVHGLMVACQAFLRLSMKDSLDINQLNFQREGFRANAYLFGRVFHLTLQP